MFLKPDKTKRGHCSAGRFWKIGTVSGSELINHGLRHVQNPASVTNNKTTINEEFFLQEFTIDVNVFEITEIRNIKLHSSQRTTRR